MWVIHLLKLFFQCISNVLMIWISHFNIFNFTLSLAIKATCRSFIQIRWSLWDLVTLIYCSTVIKDWIVYSSRCTAYRERKAATYRNFEYLFIFNCFKTSWMVTHFAVSNTDFTIWVRAPNYSLIVSINNDEERATDIDTADKDVILQFDLPWSFEFSKYSCSPNVHLTIICDSCRSVPGWDLLKVVWSWHFWAFSVIWMARVNPHRLELILIWIITDLAKVVCSTCPKLTTSVFTALGKEEGMVLSTGYLTNEHVLESANQGRKHDSILHFTSKSELTLISITASKDFIV